MKYQVHQGGVVIGEFDDMESAELCLTKMRDAYAIQSVEDVVVEEQV